MISVAVWAVLTLLTWAFIGAIGYFTLALALLVAVAWAVVVWGGFLIFDSDDFF